MMAPASQALRPARELARRISFMWVTKMLVTAGGIALFLRLYFAVMSHPLGTPRAVHMTQLDHWIPASEWMLVPYASLWFYLSLSLALVGTRAEVRAFVTAALSMSVAGLLVFWTLPTFAPIDFTHIGEYPWLAFLRKTDVLGNALPSLHVAFALLSWCLIRQQLRAMRVPSWWRAVNTLWFLAICYSTLATRQHAIVDVLGGVVFGWAFWSLHASFMRRSAANAAAGLPHRAADTPGV